MCYYKLVMIRNTIVKNELELTGHSNVDLVTST